MGKKTNLVGEIIQDPKVKPLSPHLQVYRPQITSVLSITHRMTGVVLSVGSLGLACWIIAGAFGEQVFSVAQLIISHWISQLLLFAWTLCLFYHLLNGIRHLFWDAGKGLEISQVTWSGWFVVSSACVLNIIFWLIGYGFFAKLV